MPASNALKGFRQALRLPEALLSLERQYKDPPPLDDEDTVQALRGGAAILMVAAFESFLSVMVKEHLAKLVKDPPPVAWRDLPTDLKVRDVWLSLEGALRGQRRGSQLKKLDRLPQVVRKAELVAIGQLDPEALSDTGGNPNSDTVKELLKRLGVTDPFRTIRPTFDRHWKKPEADTFVRDKLDEIVFRRHRVAHTAKALNIARRDLRESVRFLRAFAKTLDQATRQQVTALIRSARRSGPKGTP